VAGARGPVPEQFPSAGSPEQFPPLAGQRGPGERGGAVPSTGDQAPPGGRPGGPDDDNPEQTQQVRF
jgi:hypothetical protein